MSNIIYLTENQKKWKVHYDKLINRAQHRTLEGYVERHHILPRCMGGADAKDNIVNLMAREHYIAHQLLVKIYPNIPGLVYACVFMCYDKNGNRVNNRLYEWIKAKHSQNKKGKTAENNEGMRRGAEKRRGRTKENHDGVRKISESRLGQTKDNNESVARMAKTLSGRTRETHNYLAIVGDKLRGRTKETNNGVLVGSLKRTKITPEINNKIIDFRKQGFTIKEIQNVCLNSYNINVSISYLYSIKQYKEIENDTNFIS